MLATLRMGSLLHAFMGYRAGRRRRESTGRSTGPNSTRKAETVSCPTLANLAFLLILVDY